MRAPPRPHRSPSGREAPTSRALSERLAELLTFHPTRCQAASPRRPSSPSIAFQKQRSFAHAASPAGECFRALDFAAVPRPQIPPPAGVLGSVPRPAAPPSSCAATRSSRPRSPSRRLSRATRRREASSPCTARSACPGRCRSSCGFPGLVLHRRHRVPRLPDVPVYPASHGWFACRRCSRRSSTPSRSRDAGHRQVVAGRGRQGGE